MTENDTKNIVRICKKLKKIVQNEKATDIDDVIKIIGNIFSLNFIVTPWNLKERQIYGLSKAGKDNNIYIFFEKTTTSNHSLLIIFHEIGHWILGHHNNEFMSRNDEYMAEIFAIEMLSRFTSLQCKTSSETDPLIMSLIG